MMQLSTFSTVVLRGVAVAVRTALGREPAKTAPAAQDPLTLVRETWALLSDYSWTLASAADLQFMATGLRATYAYAFGIEVRQIEFVSLSATFAIAGLPEFIGAEARKRIENRLAYAMADELSMASFAERVEASRPESVPNGWESEPEAFAEPRFSAGIEFLLAEKHGPLASASTKTVAAAMREHWLRVRVDHESAGVTRDLLVSFRYALPLCPHPDKPATILALCA